MDEMRFTELAEVFRLHDVFPQVDWGNTRDRQIILNCLNQGHALRYEFHNIVNRINLAGYEGSQTKINIELCKALELFDFVLAIAAAYNARISMVREDKDAVPS